MMASSLDSTIAASWRSARSAWLAFADSNQHVYGADESIRSVVQRGGKRHERHSCAVRSLSDCLITSDGPPLLQGDGQL